VQSREAVERMEAVGERIQSSIDLMAKVFKHHEAFLTDWLDRFKAICEESNEVQAVESTEQGRPEEGREGLDSGDADEGRSTS
jgi:putative N-acetylmannosamine-6-phosphate epimerase